MKKTKKLLAVFAAVGVALMLPLQTMAAVDLNAKYDISTNQIQGWPAGPDITSDTGILMDADTGVVLYNKGGDEQRYPASITKIMTLLVAAENSTMDEKVTFTETGVRNVTADSSNIGTKVGEVLTMEDCLHALIIQSANDVAAQIAEHIGGTEQAFIDMMNQRASEIGCTNTHFANPNGLHLSNHYSTAYDLYLIFNAAIQNETFLEILKTTDYTANYTDAAGTPVSQEWTSTNKYLAGTETAPDGITVLGGKTGTTGEAGYCLVLLSQNASGQNLISIVLKADCRDNLYLLMNEMLRQYGN